MTYDKSKEKKSVAQHFAKAAGFMAAVYWTTRLIDAVVKSK